MVDLDIDGSLQIILVGPAFVICIFALFSLVVCCSELSDRARACFAVNIHHPRRDSDSDRHGGRHSQRDDSRRDLEPETELAAVGPWMGQSLEIV